jgi:hypothetical protein
MLRTRGGRLLWGRLPLVRDLRINTITPLSTGRMTSGASPTATINRAEIFSPRS